MFIMDEPTNSMDDNSELYFMEKFKEHFSDRTLFLITHRASMLKLVDRLIVFDQGSVVADGPKKEVIEALKSRKLTAKDK
jgi:ATP-binding cassette subfamily C protein LapB